MSSLTLANGSPVARRPATSIVCPASASRQVPSAVKFSNARPSGSIRSWHELHSLFARCTASISLNFGSRPLNPLIASSSAGTSGGGGGGGVPRMFSKTNSPRFTGDVRVGFDVTASTAPCVSTPPRVLLAGNRTSRISSPVTSGRP